MLRLKWLTFSLLPKLFCDEIVGMNGFAVIPSVTTTTTSGEPIASDVARKQNLLELDREGLERFFEDVLGEKRYRAHQVMKWIHHRYVADFEQMTDVGKALRTRLQACAEVRVPVLSSTSTQPMAHTSGCWRWALIEKMRLRLFISRTKGVVRCVCLRK